jgi:hypothetical protein
MSPTRICSGPAKGVPCPARALVQARPSSKTAARCATCQPQWQQAKDNRRPERRAAAAIDRNRQAVEAWASEHGYVCPGSPDCGGQPHHADPVHNPLTAEHVGAVTLTGDEHGPVVVLCRRGNSGGGARLARR